MNKEEELKKEIEINLKNVYEGKPLTIPLAVLNGEFKKRYNYETQKAYHKTYYQRPEVKARQKAYFKAYYQRPEVKAHRKSYLQRPEVKARQKACQKAYQKAYYQRKKQEKLK